MNTKVKNKHRIKKIKYFKNSSFKKLALFSHFDIKNRIDKYVVEYIKSLNKFGFDIVFITTSKNLSYLEIRKIKKYINILIIKENIGYDFAAWQCGLNIVSNYKKYYTILHVNDSIIFPISNPSRLFKNASKYDFYGLTSSIQKDFHIQSFFLFFNKKLINSKLYKQFWENIDFTLDKRQIIDNYEIGLTKLIQKQNFKVGAFVENKNITQLKENNPYWFAWDILIDKFNAPFIKKNMLLRSHSEFNETTQLLNYFVNEKYFNIIQKYVERYEICEHTKLSLNKIDFNYDIYIHLKSILQELITKDTNKILLYGYGIFGKVIHSILKDKISIVIDQKFKQKDLGTKIFKKQIFYNLDDQIDYNQFDLIISTPISDNSTVIKYFKKKLTKPINVVKVINIFNEEDRKNIKIVAKALYLNDFKRLPHSKIDFIVNNKYSNIIKFMQNYSSFHKLSKIKTAPMNSDNLYKLVFNYQTNSKI